MAEFNILVRSPNWVGDQILAFPFFSALRQRYSNAHIAAVCVPWVKDLQYRDLVDETFVIPRLSTHNLYSRLRAVDRTAREIRKRRRWDLGISLPDSFASAWLLFRSGAKTRVGYNAEARRFLLTSAIGSNNRNDQHQSTEYLQLLSSDLAFDIESALKKFDPAASWPNDIPLVPPSEPYWVLAPGSVAESRRWPAEHFMTLSKLILEETGWTGIIVGGIAENELGARLVASVNPHLHDWTGKGSVSSLWRLFREARFTVANDSGLAHVAALCGSTVYVVYGAGNPKHIRPLGPGKVRITYNAVDCWPCERNFCAQPRESHLKCLKGIPAEQIWSQLRTDVLQQA